MAKPIITAERLRQLLSYDPLTGIFTRKVSAGRAKAGSLAATKSDQGYIRIGVDGNVYLAHVLAWLYMTGEWPKSEVDHKFGVRHDNRWSELRLASRSQNQQNQRGAHGSTVSGMLGVYFDKSRGKWVAMICVNGSRKHLGRFSTPDLAYAAYIRAKRELHEFQTIA